MASAPLADVADPHPLDALLAVLARRRAVVPLASLPARLAMPADVVAALVDDALDAGLVELWEEAEGGPALVLERLGRAAPRARDDHRGALAGRPLPMGGPQEGAVHDVGKVAVQVLDATRPARSNETIGTAILMSAAVLVILIALYLVRRGRGPRGEDRDGP